MFSITNIFNKKDLFLGLKKAYTVSLLPAKIEVFYSSIIMRIFRVIGGICLVLILTGRYVIFYKELQILIMIFALLHSILIISISLIKLFYGLYVIIKKPNVFEVRNSPINQSATHIARLLVCAKWGCGAVAGTTGILTSAITYDTVLEATGREKVFLPTIAKAFNNFFGEPMNTENYQNLNKGLSVTPAPEGFNPVEFKKSYDQMSANEKQAVIDIVENERKSRAGK